MKDCTSDLCTCVSVDLKSCGVWYLWAGPPREPGANLSSCLSFPSVSGPIGIPSFGEVGYLINLWVWCLLWIFFLVVVSPLFVFSFDFLRVDANLTLSFLSMFSFGNQTGLFLFMRWWNTLKVERKKAWERICPLLPLGSSLAAPEFPGKALRYSEQRLSGLWAAFLFQNPERRTSGISWSKPISI